jgi:hypothetical protein
LNGKVQDENLAPRAISPVEERNPSSFDKEKPTGEDDAASGSGTPPVAPKPSIADLLSNVETNIFAACCDSPVDQPRPMGPYGAAKGLSFNITPPAPQTFRPISAPAPDLSSMSSFYRDAYIASITNGFMTDETIPFGLTHVESLEDIPSLVGSDDEGGPAARSTPRSRARAAARNNNSQIDAELENLFN